MSMVCIPVQSACCEYPVVSKILPLIPQFSQLAHSSVGQAQPKGM